jgi:hypothetical protein
MKTNTDSNTKSGASSRPEPRERLASRPPIDFALRRTNRSLVTEKLLALLRSDAPGFFAVAEVVGKWVWIQFEGKQPSERTRLLAELGFHWNHSRQTWQHPCGTVAFERATYDPRRRYGSYFADTKTDTKRVKNS